MKTKGGKFNFIKTVEKFNAIIDESCKFLYLARSTALQHEQCLILDSLQKQASQAKRFFISIRIECYANAFLGFECLIGSIRAELMMYLLLKKNMPNQAWEQLISAQIGCVDAMRADEGFSSCEDRLSNLEKLEKTLFPKQVFNSAGFTAERIDCSICNTPYLKCSHLRGKVYMGQFCEIVHLNIKGNHLAIVENPADKRCRITAEKTEHGHRDVMSLVITPYTKEETFEFDGPLFVSSILMCEDRYPYLSPSSEIIK